MVYIFEGCRNSGKTYLSSFVSEKFSIPRFQFSFPSYLNLLKIETRESREAHSFSMGKELMIMQLSKDLGGNFPDVIHDRGILTVLAWALCENRITESEVDEQINYIRDNSLLDNCMIIYIEGENPNGSHRNKDQWDYMEKSSAEKEAYDLVISKFKKAGLEKIYGFVNRFDEKSKSNMESLFEHILFD
jgi:hypothetical protein